MENIETKDSNNQKQKVRLRHPEKAHRKDNISPRKPDWIRVRIRSDQGFNQTRNIVEKNKLVTICEEASCPNISECWQKKHASFLILGGICTRACSFCNVATGKPKAVDPFEPYNLAKAVSDLGLNHVVVTSVDRDDLEDGGAKHFLDCVRAIRNKSPNTTIELLTPDFRGKNTALDILLQSPPDVFNHNLETVPRLYLAIRPGSRYFTSLNLLLKVKDLLPDIFTKSGLMVGLGEDDNEIYQVMDDLRSAKVDFLTIGQYLQPSLKHAKVERYVRPEIFEKYKKIAKAKGFLMVSASPFTRSSHHAGEDYLKLKANRLKSLAK